MVSSMVNSVHPPKKANTKGQSRQLRPDEAQIIRRTNGLAKRIAQFGRFGKSYVSMVVARKKPASERFLVAMQSAMLEDAQGRTTLAMLSGLPEPVEAG